MSSYKKYYQGFLANHPHVQHYACHSHHYWPDVTRDAMLAYWDDSARLVDDKWDLILGEKVPAVQRKIADILHLSHAEQIVFAPNTHELLFRLLSCFDWQQPLTIVTSDSEFHSFQRQSQRLAELPHVTLVAVPSEPVATFPARLMAAVAQSKPHLIFFSQVFFNSGLVVPRLTELLQQLAQQTDAVIAVDGYHGFMALPTDLSAVEGRIFYLAGSYKYAQGGEGCCFMAVPKHNQLRPIYTGWFAGFAQLAHGQAQHVSYSDDGYQFAGSTMDYAALYRLDAALTLLSQAQITVAQIHAHVQQLQQAFLQQLDEIQHPLLHRDCLLVNDMAEHGHFLTFELPSAQQTAEFAAWLKQQGIHTDYRGTRLRFGFALYHDISDIRLDCLKQG